MVEPLLLGLLVAGTPHGLLLAAATLAAFLIHQPLRLALKDHLKGRRIARTIWAERFAAAYGLLTLLLLGIVTLTSELHVVLPLLVALPFLLIQVWYDARNQSRTLVAEISGAVALGSAASAIAILGGWTLLQALPLWWLVSSRSTPSILYVRARLKLEHGKPVKRYPVWIAHSAALLLALPLVSISLIPVSALAAIALLLVRAIVGLSRHRKPRPAKQIGLLEMAYGFLFVAIVVAGYVLNI